MFTRDLQKKDGLRSDCRECHREARQAYEDANREAKRKYDRAYYRENSETIKARAAAWRAQNAEVVAMAHASCNVKRGAGRIAAQLRLIG